MTYQETVEYLFAKLPMFSRIGAAAYKEDLGNTIRLCEFLGNPQNLFKSVHIAGTNGKGSVSHMLGAIFQSAGYKTGLYTSPHLKDFRERIKISGDPPGLGEITEEFVVGFTERIKPLIREIEPSFFEITVAMAFDFFASGNADIAIIETGLGGRLDSTNIVTPELSVITNIGMDHQDLLGNTLAKIAAEKAGIIKKGIPVVIGEVLPETQAVFEAKAKEMDSALFIASQKRQATDWRWEKNELIVEVGEEHKTDHTVYHLDLPGIYQRKNLLTVLEACTQMKEQGWKLDDTAIQKGLKHAKKITGLHGRWEMIQTSPAVILDVAHNEDGIRQLVEQIELTDHHELHLVIGFVKDKEVDKILSLLPKTAHYYFTRAQIPRALHEETLEEKARQYDLKGKTFKNVNAALSEARARAGKDDLVVVCGSVFLIGEVRL